MPKDFSLIKVGETFTPFTKMNKKELIKIIQKQCLEIKKLKEQMEYYHVQELIEQLAEANKIIKNLGTTDLPELLAEFYIELKSEYPNTEGFADYFKWLKHQGEEEAREFLVKKQKGEGV